MFWFRSDRLVAAVLIGVGILGHAANAELRPDQVAVIAAKGNNESTSVAAYYAKVRGIPPSNILQLELPKGEELPRATWAKQTRPAIRRWLAAEGRLRKIRCFCTVWDVPLRIGSEENSKELARLVGYLQRERVSRIKTLGNYAQALDQLAEGSPTGTALPDNATLQQINERLQAALEGAQQRVDAIEDDAQKADARSELRTIYVRVLGLNNVVNSLRRTQLAGTSGADPRVRSEFDITQGRAFGLREGRMAIEAMPVGFEREPQLLAMIQATDGIFGSVAWLDDQVESLKKNETGSSFDSELSLVAWPDYQIIRWQPNYWHYRFDDSPIRDYKLSFMVSRIEAPTLPLTRKMIDDAIAVEKTGLQGKIYLDGRGLIREGQTPQGGDLTEGFDQLLVAAAKVIRDASDIEVVLDTRTGLFETGTAADAALYCGWYSMAKYVDAFEFNQGAFGYHLGGAEAQTIRTSSSQLWCKSLLEDGVVGTIGPVADGSVGNYPRPNELFVLLLSGRYTLAESYYRCNPFSSWSMVLIGDPLYSPYKATSPLDVTKLPDDLRRVIEGLYAVF